MPALRIQELLPPRLRRGRTDPGRGRRHRSRDARLRCLAPVGLAAVVVALVQPAQAVPATVLLFRHGHKDGDGRNFNLSVQGLQRSLSLASLVPACFGRVSHIVAYALNPETGKNARSYQTAIPLAVTTGVNIRVEAGSEAGSFEIGRRIRNDPAYSGATVVVFWEHRRLPDLAAGLGWPTMPPIRDDDFDRLDVLRYTSSMGDPAVRQVNLSRLLDGSQPCSSPTDP